MSAVRCRVAIPLLSVVTGLIAVNALADVVATLPPNVVIVDELRTVVADMLHTSPAFRDQCQRLRRHGNLVVRIQLTDARAATPGRAQCLLQRYEFGHVKATVLLRSRTDAAELIAHELEHVLEFAEGTDYRVLSMQYPTLAWIGKGGHFETRRAINAGQRVATEMMRTRMALR